MELYQKPIIHNENITFRLPNTMRDGLADLAIKMDVHVSHIVRIACSELLKQARDTGRIIQRVE